jgi:hypothetical protein
MNNVVDLQKLKEEKQQKKLDEIIEKYESQEDLINAIIESAAIDVIELLEFNEIDVEGNPESIKDIMFLTDAIRSLIYRIQGKPHPFHEVCNATFDQLDIDYNELMQLFLYGDE